MTRRERLERKLEKRQEWAEGRDAKADALRAQDSHLRHDWAFITQPGRIPARERMNRRDDKAHEHHQMADHHREKADGLASQLERNIYSDDTDAVEQLRAKIARLQAADDVAKLLNAAMRKGRKAAGGKGTAADRDADVIQKGIEAAVTAPGFTEGHARYLAQSMRAFPWPPKFGTNAAEIRRCKQRIKDIEHVAARSAKAEAAGGVLIDDCGVGYARVTFAEKPDREILNALKAAGFSWGGGSWLGKRKNLPAVVLAMVTP